MIFVIPIMTTFVPWIVFCMLDQVVLNGIKLFFPASFVLLLAIGHLQILANWWTIITSSQRSLAAKSMAGSA
jgi:hypothetical protein